MCALKLFWTVRTNDRSITSLPLKRCVKASFVFDNVVVQPQLHFDVVRLVRKCQLTQVVLDLLEGRWRSLDNLKTLAGSHKVNPL